jgi:hypothetical protein
VEAGKHVCTHAHMHPLPHSKLTTSRGKKITCTHFYGASVYLFRTYSSLDSHLYSYLRIIPAAVQVGLVQRLTELQLSPEMVFLGNLSLRQKL